jgi:spore maturation protein B
MIQNIVNLISIWAIPVFLIGIPLYGAVRGVKVYESFVEGAKEGFQIAVRIIPYLVASGRSRNRFVEPEVLTSQVGRPGACANRHTRGNRTANIMRALSGSGSLGIVTELGKTHGPDSFIARLAASIYGTRKPRSTFWRSISARSGSSHGMRSWRG